MRDTGSPPSLESLSTNVPHKWGDFIAKAHLAKAYVIRLEVVMMLVVANSKHTRGKLKFQVRSGGD